jgi:predicted transcriptional regulator
MRNQAIKDVEASYDTLVDLLESIEHFLKRLDIYTKLPPTPAMAEILVKIMVALLSTLGVVTKQMAQKRPGVSPSLSCIVTYRNPTQVKLLKKIFGENDVEAVLRRLDRLTQDEARVTSAQTLAVVCDLVQNMRVVMDGEHALLYLSLI